MERESNILEYKSEYTDDIKRTVIAFANTIGGKIIIGINDDLSVCGVEDTDDVILKITSSIRDTIKPDISVFVNYTIKTLEDELCTSTKNVLIVDVQRGTASPYYLAKKGVRPEGVFVRRGTATLQATETDIFNMIKENTNDTYETVCSLEQNLTFKNCNEEFEKAELKFQKEQMRTLKIINNDGNFSNLAMLLSDQCIHTIKIAVFDGTKKLIFKNRREFTGSLFKQMRECMDFIDIYNSTRSEKQRLERIDYRDYPVIAIREALLNALVHRDYSFGASSTLISIFDDRIEFLSVGGLLRGITQDDIMIGVSALRNKNLADIFYRLKLIEAYGSGITTIMESYDTYSIAPTIQTTNNAFKITLYNINLNKNNENLNHEEQKVIELCSQKDYITRGDIEKMLNVGQTVATNILNSLIEKNFIARLGKGFSI